MLEYEVPCWWIELPVHTPVPHIRLGPCDSTTTEFQSMQSLYFHENDSQQCFVLRSEIGLYHNPSMCLDISFHLHWCTMVKDLPTGSTFHKE